MKKGETEAEGTAVQDYSLFFSARVGGTETRQLLVTHPAFDDEMIDILFVGDLDGDSIPDVIINKSNHYNVTNPALFLSKPAGKGTLLKEVGEHRSIGC
ncbi:hypothetical protein [Hymenobacter canadensis]|uniref:VCBS repeat-containing protein n=1 Tax=Hymenobacter canadensis TaxID=2999067 RepID=A0ABY7LWA7_9BACT|nr:hypothetical protein [Hymenobacter canadensis]WBA44174.1 hypothetical protein O3303_20010 [Hymenobacter canadensis]